MTVLNSVNSCREVKKDQGMKVFTDLANWRRSAIILFRAVSVELFACVPEILNMSEISINVEVFLLKNTVH